MNIKIPGAGCPNCRNLEKAVINTLAEMEVDADVEKVEDIVRIMSYGVMRTPCLVIDGQVVVSGRVPSAKEIRKIIEEKTAK